jgi:hypothetical protein
MGLSMARWRGDMTEEEKPCCPTSAARNIKKIEVDGQEVGIAQLDQIINKVAALGLRSEEEVGRALLKEVKIFNYVPASKEPDYQRAIIKEYSKRK